MAAKCRGWRGGGRTIRLGAASQVQSDQDNKVREGGGQVREEGGMRDRACAYGWWGLGHSLGGHSQ